MDTKRYSQRVQPEEALDYRIADDCIAYVDAALKKKRRKRDDTDTIG